MSSVLIMSICRDDAPFATPVLVPEIVGFRLVVLLISLPSIVGRSTSHSRGLVRRSISGIPRFS